MTFTDSELIHQTVTGNPEAFGVLVQRYQTAIYGFAFHLIGNFADAEDITQEAFITAYEKLPQLAVPDRFATWLRRITANLCKMRLRGKRELLSIERLDGETMQHLMDSSKRIPTPAEECIRKETTDTVMNAINSLPEKERLVVTLYYLDGLTCREIGDFLSVPKGTIQSRLHRARKQLKEELIKMVQDTFKENQLSPEFAQQVLETAMKRGNEYLRAAANSFPHKNFLYGKAAEEFLKATQAASENVDAHCRLATAYRQTYLHVDHLEETYDKAKAEFERVLELNPNHADSHANLGIIHLVKGNKQEALARFQKAIQLNPNDICCRADLALMYVARGMLDEAAEQLLRALELAESPKVAYMNLIHNLITRARFLGFCEG